MKRKTRVFKKKELQIRQEIRFDYPCQLVWSWLFGDEDAVYNLYEMSLMTHEERKSVFDHFMALVYIRYYSSLRYQSKVTLAEVESEFTAIMQATDMKTIEQSLKDRLKLTHPDNGGSQEAFIEAMKAYHLYKKGS